jgi:hypothetical protein
VKTSNDEMTHTKKVLNESKYILNSHIFALMTALHTLDIISTSFMRNDLSNILEGVEHLLVAFPSLFGPTHPKLFQLC